MSLPPASLQVHTPPLGWTSISLQSLANDPAKQSAFISDIKAAVLAADKNLQASWLTVTLAPGSVVATVLIHVPDGVLADSAMNSVVSSLTSNPDALFGASFKSTYGITGPVAVTYTLPPGR